MGRDNREIGAVNVSIQLRFSTSTTSTRAPFLQRYLRSERLRRLARLQRTVSPSEAPVKLQYSLLIKYFYCEADNYG